jgi:hypothetical protein
MFADGIAVSAVAETLLAERAFAVQVKQRLKVIEV